MILMYEDSMEEEKRTALLNGLNELDARTAKNFSTSFVKAEPIQKMTLLTTIRQKNGI